MGTNFSKTRIELRISNKPDFVSSIVLFFTGIIFYFVIIPREIILEDEAVIGPDLLPNICIILITFLSILLFIKSVKNVNQIDGDITEQNKLDMFKGNYFSLIEIKRVFLLSLTILASILLFTYVDVLLASIFLVLGSCFVCGLKKIWVISTLSAGLILLAYFLLYKVLGTAVG